MSAQAPTIELPERLQNRLKTCGTLPSIPAVAIRIIDMCRQDEVGIPEISAVLANDPALAAKVLRTANSALYCMRSPATTLDRAISILGINATLSLALSFSLVETLHKTGRNGFNHRTYWRRSVITATTAKALMVSAYPTGSDEYFLAGLLQDIGMLALNEAVPGAYGNVVGDAGGDHEKLVELERRVFGADHSAVGGWLLERWKLPEKLIASVASSHGGKYPVDPEIAAFCRTVAFAGDFAEIWAHPQVAEAMCRARQSASDRLEMSPDRFEDLLERVALLLPEIMSSLEVQIGSDKNLNHLLNRAREALVDLNLQAQQQVRMAREESNRDPLTSLYNRRYLEDALPKSLDEAVRLKQPLSMVFIDIDHFKKVNDTHGHQAGDAVLVALSGMLLDALRSADLAIRYGGEEFVCILTGTPRSGAESVAERIRSMVASTPLRVADGVEINVTVSLGCATFSGENPSLGAADLLNQADRCLYAAKLGGRNRVIAAA